VVVRVLNETIHFSRVRGWPSEVLLEMVLRASYPPYACLSRATATLSVRINSGFYSYFCHIHPLGSVIPLAEGRYSRGVLRAERDAVPAGA